MGIDVQVGGIVKKTRAAIDRFAEGKRWCSAEIDLFRVGRIDRDSNVIEALRVAET